MGTLNACTNAIKYKCFGFGQNEKLQLLLWVKQAPVKVAHLLVWVRGWVEKGIPPTYWYIHHVGDPRGLNKYVETFFRTPLIFGEGRPSVLPMLMCEVGLDRVWFHRPLFTGFLTEVPCPLSIQVSAYCIRPLGKVRDISFLFCDPSYLVQRAG